LTPTIPDDVDFISDLKLGAVIAVDGVDDFAVFFELAKETALFIGEAGDKLCLAAVGGLFERRTFSENEDQNQQCYKHNENDVICFHFFSFFRLDIFFLATGEDHNCHRNYKSYDRKNSNKCFHIYRV